MKHIANQNTTFRAWDPTWANACVGNNGSPQIYEYASGYALAANLLLDQVIRNKGMTLHVDTFIYPICFNMRHAIELFLKATAVSLKKLANMKSYAIPEFDLAGSHDLGNIWTYIRDHAKGFDQRYRPLVQELDQYVVDVAEIDATGQVFRYPFDQETNKHLTSVSVINLVILKSRWAILERLLDSLNRLTDDLLTEYGRGGFTTKLSRQQLAKIAAMLPTRDRWSSPEFSQVKFAVCEHYGLSSNDFSRALKVIQSRRELAAICAHVKPIPDLDAAVLGQFFDIWLKEHDLKKVIALPDEGDSGFDFSQPSLEEMISYHERSLRLTREVVETVKPESFAALCALFYFDRVEKFSEYFESLLTQHLRASEKYIADPGAYISDADQLLEKTSALTSILNSLNFLGQIELVKVIVDRFQLHAHAARLLEPSDLARKRILEGYSYV
jgi:hypothetical protein